ncbi:MAG: HAD family hydrolase [Bacteriovoracaceae bacterium]|nr:HAD family hydrolase [Bacteriovoracaceae bacterium]
MTYKVCIFDLDGTIIDSGDFILEGVRYALAPWDKKITSRDIEEIRDRKPEHLFRGHVPSQKDAIAAWERLNEFSQKHSENIKVFPGMEKILKKLCKKVFTAVWTGRDVQSAREVLKNKGLLSYFDIVVGSTMDMENKPHPEGLLKIANASSANPNEMVLIGDHPHDVLGAKTLDCYSVHVTWGKHDLPEDMKQKPDVIVKNVEALGNWLDKTFS